MALDQTESGRGCREVWWGVGRRGGVLSSVLRKRAWAQSSGRDTGWGLR